MTALFSEAPSRRIDGDLDVDLEVAPSALVLVAHRGPVRFTRSGDGDRQMARNAGGLVTALEGIVREVDDVRWICATASDEDRRAARARPWLPFTAGSSRYAVRMLDLERDAHHDFYNVIANPLLWFVQHDLYGPTRPEIGQREWRAWRDGYVRVNREFANVLVDRTNVPVESTVMVHDYHFYLLPAMVRDARPDLVIQHFTHIPWPRPEAWRALPATMRHAIFRGLLGSDIIGFHTERYVQNFLAGCEELLGVRVDRRRSSVSFEGRDVAVRRYPISVDAAATRRFAAGNGVGERRRALEAELPEKVILRVDRADPAKNIVRGFEAFGLLLRAHPELRGRVCFLALLQPTRGEVKEYADYLGRIHAIVDAVNEEFGAGDWLPIDLRLVEDLALAYAAYGLFDVLLVNSLADGMNLVVKEALLVNERDGVIVLSERAGAGDELGAVALTVDPFDVDAQARALYEGLHMRADVRRRRLRAGAEIVENNGMQKWLRHQLSDIQLTRMAKQVGRARLQPAS